MSDIAIGSGAPGEALRIDVDGAIPDSLGGFFEASLREALHGRRRAAHYRARLEPARREGDVVLRIRGAGWEVPLYFVGAPALHREDVVRILTTVLEGLGPVSP